VDIIVYQRTNQPVSIVNPCECGLTIKEIGQKDVPRGLPFWIVDASVVPEDRSLRDAWQLDIDAMGAPSGTGGTYTPPEQAE